MSRGFVALITGADFLGKDLGNRKANDFGRYERQQLEITLLDLGQAYSRQRRCLAPTDLELNFASRHWRSSHGNRSD